jgi:hypothetical protein
MMMMSHPQLKTKTKRAETWKHAIDATGKSIGISVWDADAV